LIFQVANNVVAFDPNLWQKAFAPDSWPNWALVVVGILGVGAALRTLSAIQRQVDVMKDQTDIVARQATSMRRQTTILRRSVDAAIAGDRAWIMVQLEKSTRGLFITDGFSRDGNRREYSTTVCVDCTCTNQGKTPARISEIRAKLLILESVDSTEDLPDQPDLDIESMFQVNEPMSADAGHTYALDLSCPQQRQTKMMIIYGVVKYHHMFSEAEVQTTFGYRITPGDNLVRLRDKLKYNENT
jgi:hypothetical protein